MKGFLTAHDHLFRKTHDLDVLANACEGLVPTLSPVLRPARELTVFAWVFRYPGETTEPTLEEGTHGLTVAREAYERLLAQLPDAVHP